MLLLRKESEKILKKVGLEDFHIEKSMGGHLAIVGKCGKRLLSISSIPVSNKLSGEQREYITELLERFINEHREKIDNYVKEYIKFNEKWKDTDIDELDEKASTYDSNIFFRYENGKQKVSFKTYVNLDIEDVKKFVNDKEAHKKAFEAYLKSKEYRKDLKELNSFESELSRCTI
jgi:hypothetical protein